MRFAHLIYVDETATDRRTPDEIRTAVAAHAPYIAMLKRTGRYHGSEALAATALARTLRRVNDRPPPPVLVDVILHQIVPHAGFHGTGGDRFVAVPGDQHEGGR